jgi:hypothetical protein
MALAWPFKDPNEVLDYRVDWSSRLDSGDTINGSTFSVAVGDGLTIDTSVYTNTTATVWFSGGTSGTTYEILNRITTTDGRTHDQTVKLKVRSK